MTARYRCPWCGSFASSDAKATRRHVLEQHRSALVVGLAPVEAFGTRKTPDPPRNAANPRRPLNRGVSGEGDTVEEERCHEQHS